MSRPITCTACNQSFQTWANWLEHRAVIRSWEMHHYEDHTRRCLSEHDWAMMVLAEMMGIQEQAQSHSEGLVYAREGHTESGLVNIPALSNQRSYAFTQLSEWHCSVGVSSQFGAFNGYCLVRGCSNEAMTGSPYCLKHRKR